ncbi:unnamed protein product [Brassica rapa]|uniref:Uncharacterized protein n=1 Tax=Brassica campestris TaxID=3711 RepID=A0A8D9G883_BRACM|nr:unnamed protein product [Brassica rapa]
MCTDGQPRTSYSPRGPKSPEQSKGRASMLILCVQTDTHGQPRTSCVCWRTPTDVLTNVLICVLMDSHRRPVYADGHTRTATDVLSTDILCVLNRQPTWAKIIRTVHGKDQRAESKDQRADMCTDGQPRPHTRTHTDTHGHTRTATDVLCVLADTHGRPVCADGHPRTSYTHEDTRTAMDVLYIMCVLTNTHGRPVCTEQTAQVGQNHPNSPRERPARASVLSRRTSMLICVLMDSHRRPVCADGQTRTHMDTATNVMCMLTDTHGRPVCADEHSRTSCVHGRSMCADGHTRTHTTSYVCWRTPTDVLCVLNRQPTWAKITQTVHGKGQRAESKDQRADMCIDGEPRTSCTDTHGHTRSATDVLCVLADTHGRPVSTDSHRRPVCAGRHPRTSCVHGRPVCSGGHPRTSYSPRWPKSPKQSTGRASVLSPRTSVLICVLIDSHRRPVVLICVLMDSHGRPVCADGHTRTATDVLCVLVDSHIHSPRGQKSPEQSTGRVSVLNPRTNVRICALMDSHGRPVCADGHTQTHTDSHRRPVCADGHTRTSSTDVLCVLADTHRRPVCAGGHPQTSCVY